MKATYIVADERSAEGWQETHDFDNGEPEAVLTAMVERFNATLRPHERPRRLVRIISVEGEPMPHKIPHAWEKQNLVTIIDRHGTYDKMKCRVCGITGKRFGLGPDVQKDLKFCHPVHESCTSYDL